MGQCYTLRWKNLAPGPRPSPTCGNLPLFTGVLRGAFRGAGVGASSKRKIRTPKAWKKASQLNGAPWLLAGAGAKDDFSLVKRWKYVSPQKEGVHSF